MDRGRAQKIIAQASRMKAGQVESFDLSREITRSELPKLERQINQAHGGEGLKFTLLAPGSSFETSGQVRIYCAAVMGEAA